VFECCRLQIYRWWRLSRADAGRGGPIQGFRRPFNAKESSITGGIVEIGARWETKNKFLPVLAAGAKPELLKGLLNVFQAVDCENYNDFKTVMREAATALGKTFSVTEPFDRAFGQLQKESSSSAKVYSPRLQIQRALWGHGAETFDVTEQMKKFIRNDMLVVQASRDSFGEPCFGKPKRLSITYLYDGDSREIHISEHDWLALPE